MSRTDRKARVDVDVVVIGAGLTGLTYANTALRKGYRVAVLDKHFKPGGYATNFQRKHGHYVFDCSLHKITGLGPDGNLRNALQRAGLWELVEFHPYQDLSCVLVGDHRYELPSDYAELQRRLYAWFPRSRAGLTRFFGDLESHGRQNYMFARMAMGEYQPNLDLLEGSRALSRTSATAYFSSLFVDFDLRAIFSTLAINLGAMAQEIDALYFLHFAYTFLTMGACYVKGTSQSLSDALAAEVARRGGRVYLKERAERISIAAGAVEMVESTRYVFSTGEVVATCSPHDVYDMLALPEVLGEKFAPMLGDLEFGYGAFTLYVGLDVAPELLGLERSEYILIPCAEGEVTAEVLESDERYQRLPMEITNYHKLDPAQGCIIEMTILEHAGQWFSLDKAQYNAEKARVGAILWERALQAFPLLRDHVVCMDTSTPRTNYRYTLSPHGSAFGYKAKPGRNVRFLQRPRVGGLSFCGTWIVGAGYEPAICLGFTQAYLKPDMSTQSKERIA